MVKIDKKCPSCEKIFTPLLCQNRKFCSRECKRTSQIGIATTPRKGTQRECLICKSAFYAFPNSTQRYCSKTCGNIGKKESNKRKKIGTYSNCKKCSTQIYVTPSKKHEKRFCSRKCQYEHLKETNEWGIRENKGWENNPYERKIVNGIRVKVHRLIMEIHLGRKLKKNEHIHHINGNPKDNRIENLQIVSPSEHSKIHARCNKRKISHSET